MLPQRPLLIIIIGGLLVLGLACSQAAPPAASTATPGAPTAPTDTPIATPGSQEEPTATSPATPSGQMGPTATSPATPSGPAEPTQAPGDSELMFPEQFPAGTTLNIVQWSHFVPRYDEWFDQWAPQWGEENGVEVSVEHINVADINSTLAASIEAGQGPTMVQAFGTPAQFVQGLQDLTDINEEAQRRFGDQVENCTRQSYLPIQDKWYGFCHGWVPDPGDYRVSLWESIGYPDGPSTYEELLDGGRQIWQQAGIPVGIGMSPEIDSEYAARSLIWSYGGSIQDEEGNVTLDSPEVVEAVRFMTNLYESAMTDEIFSWNAASNNQTFIAGEASYIQNSISFYRSAQQARPDIAQDTGFVGPLEGPTGKAINTAHIWHIYVIPNYVTNENDLLAAKKFMLDLVANYPDATMNSELYDFPAFPSTVPQLWESGGWLDNDPFDAEPPDKLKILADAEDWTGWLGYPGSANPAISEVMNTFLLSNMMSQAARGQKTPEQAVADTAAQIEEIFEKWRERGFVGGS